MADEIRVTTQLNVTNSPVNETRSDVSIITQVTKGAHSPGEVTVATTGTDISLSQVGIPGVCRVKNLDTTNFVEIGVKEPSTGFFYPMLEVGPGEGYVFKLSRNIRQEYTGTGTGTSAGTNTMHAKANTGACRVVFDIFPR